MMSAKSKQSNDEQYSVRPIARECEAALHLVLTTARIHIPTKWTKFICVQDLKEPRDPQMYQESPTMYEP